MDAASLRRSQCTGISTAVFKHSHEGLIDQGEPSVLKLTEEVDAWLSPDATVQRLLERKDELTEGFTEYELRCRSWNGLRDRALNLQALKILVESGALKKRKLPTSGRPRVEYRFRISGA